MVPGHILAFLMLSYSSVSLRSLCIESRREFKDRFHDSKSCLDLEVTGLIEWVIWGLNKQPVLCISWLYLYSIKESFCIKVSFWRNLTFFSIYLENLDTCFGSGTFFMYSRGASMLGERLESERTGERIGEMLYFLLITEEGLFDV